MAPPAPTPSAAVRDTVRALQVDRVAVDAIRALEAARVPVLLVKGAGTATLLYAGGPGRNYADVDLLVPPFALAAAGRALAAAGYACAHDDAAPGAAERVLPHSQVWRRPGASVEVDLHFSVPGVGATPERTWEALHGERVLLDLGDAAVPVPSAPARVLHVVLHAWQHRGRHERSLRDLDRALDVVDDATWDATVALARALDAEEAVAAVLAVRGPEGAAIVARHDLASGRSPLTTLWLEDPPAGTILLARVLGGAGVWARLGVLRELLLPPRVVLERATGRPVVGRRAYVAAAARRLRGAPSRLVPALSAVRASRRTAGHRIAGRRTAGRTR